MKFYSNFIVIRMANKMAANAVDENAVYRSKRWSWKWKVGRKKEHTVSLRLFDWIWSEVMLFSRMMDNSNISHLAIPFLSTS